MDYVEVPCKCCQDYYYPNVLKHGLCPICLDFLNENEILLYKRLKDKIRKVKKTKIGHVIFEKDILKIINDEIKKRK